MEWKRIKLGELCRIELGKTPSRSNKSYWDEDKAGNNIWLSIADLPLSDKSIMFDSKEYISNAGAELCKIVPKGTLIVSFKLSLGRLAVTGCDLYTNEAIAALYLNDEKKIDQNYLSWYLTFFDWDAAAGSDIKVKGKTLNKAKLKEIEIIVPPIPEQKRIVAILDQAFADIEQARAKTEQNLKNARELFESYLQQVFSQRGEGWTETTLGEISDRVSVGHVGPTSEFYCESDIGVPFLRSQNVRPYGIETSKVKFITREFHQSLKKSQLQEGDLLFVRVGANRGDCCALRSFDGELNCANIVFARPRGNSIDYLEHFCNSAFGQESLLGMTTGSAQGVINTKSVAQLRIPLPPIDEQMNIVGKINLVKVEAERLENIYTTKIQYLDELKKSILQKAFSGELTKTLEVDVNKGAVA